MKHCDKEKENKTRKKQKCLKNIRTKNNKTLRTNSDKQNQEHKNTNNSDKPYSRGA